MSVELSIIVGFGIGIAFLTYLGNRAGNNKKQQEQPTLIPRIIEGTCYSFSALLLSVMLFLLSEITAAATYGGVIKTIFIVFQILLGVLGGLGAIAFSIMLLVLSLSNIVRGIK